MDPLFHNQEATADHKQKSQMSGSTVFQPGGSSSS